MTPLHALLPVLRPMAEEALAPEIDATEVEALLNEAFGRYEAERVTLPPQRSTGGWLMLHLAALTAALYHAIVGRGRPEEEARRLTARVTWAAYEKMAVAPGMLGSVGTKDPLVRIQRATDLFRHFPFSAPSYDMRDVDAGPEVVAFDVQRCPVAEYFRARGLSELCVESWCDLDFPLAQKWGGSLERSTTLAEGADRCDFRWRGAHPG